MDSPLLAEEPSKHSRFSSLLTLGCGIVTGAAAAVLYLNQYRSDELTKTSVLNIEMKTHAQCTKNCDAKHPHGIGFNYNACLWECDDKHPILHTNLAECSSNCGDTWKRSGFKYNDCVSDCKALYDYKPAVGIHGLLEEHGGVTPDTDLLANFFLISVNFGGVTYPANVGEGTTMSDILLTLQPLGPTVNPSDVVFSYHGKQVSPTTTVGELGMTAHDVIDIEPKGDSADVALIGDKEHDGAAPDPEFRIFVKYDGPEDRMVPVAPTMNMTTVIKLWCHSRCDPSDFEVISPEATVASLGLKSGDPIEIKNIGDSADIALIGDTEHGVANPDTDSLSPYFPILVNYEGSKKTIGVASNTTMAMVIQQWCHCDPSKFEVISPPAPPDTVASRGLKQGDSITIKRRDDSEDTALIADKEPHLNIKVKGTDGNEVFFKIKKSTQLRKLMDAYCNRLGLALNSVRFRYDGEPIKQDDTPETLGMEDGDEIDGMVEQPGGDIALIADNEAHLNIKVKGTDGNEVYFKIRKSTPLKKLMDAYCNRLGVSSHSVRFLYDGDRIQPNQTPAQLGMEDNDEIDAMVEQPGGD